MAKESVFRSLQYAWTGIIRCFAIERNMLIHLTAATLAIIFAWYLEFSRIEIALVVLTSTAVLAMEMINTALEKMVDLVSPEYHPLAGLVKDIAAGAVLLVAFGSVIVGCLLYIPHLVK